MKKTKKKQIEKKKHYDKNKDIISEKLKEKRNKNKLNDFLSKLDLIDKEQLVKILIESRKTNLLDVILNIYF